MTNAYKRMFVLSEDEYKEFKRYKATQVPTSVDPHVANTVKCPKCGRDYPNENILAHHLKSHVDGFKCNICNKVFKFKRSLTKHLKQHAPQVEPSKYSVLDNDMPNQPNVHQSAPPLHQSAPPLHQSAPPLHQSAPVKARKPHKHRSVINFAVKKWLTLK